MTDTTKQQPKNHNKYRKDKPWDNDEIDHWKVPSWGAQNDEKTKDVLPGGRLLEESSFATLFPKYREHYLRSIWPLLTKSLDSYGIACELNLVEGSMTVRTTKATSDPYCILKARDLLKLLSRSIPFPQAVKILGDEWQCDIIKIGGMVRNKQRFIKRRQRLLGHDGSTLKALELLTGSYILVQGNTVSVMSSSWTGLKQTRRVVEDCMNNTQHPVYHLKRLMIVKELQKDETLVNQDWSRFLPKFQKRNVPRKKAKTSHKKQKKPYTPFPPPQQPSKIDLQLESGEYFLQPQVRDKNALSKKRALAVATSQTKRQRRDEELERPPPLSNFDSKKPPATTNIPTTPIQERIKAKLQQQAKKNRTVADYGDFVLDRKGGEK